MRKVMAALITLLLAALAGCGTSAALPTVEQAADIAKPYFMESHTMDVTVSKVDRIRVGQDAYLTRITVTDGTADYELVLDRSNAPLSDNVVSVNSTAGLDRAALAEAVAPLGFTLNTLSVSFRLGGHGYVSVLCLATEDLPRTDAKDDIRRVLTALRENGIDLCVLEVVTPEFLKPGAHGLQLSATAFDTGADWAAFDAAYQEFTASIHWDREAFTAKVAELARTGYPNARFAVVNLTVDSVEIGLLGLPASTRTEEQCNALLAGMDNGCFRVEGRETVFTVP